MSLAAGGKKNKHLVEIVFPFLSLPAEIFKDLVLTIAITEYQEKVKINK